MAATMQLFDRALLCERRRRLARKMLSERNNQGAPDFLLAYAVNDVADRLSMIQREFKSALVIGGHHGLMTQRLAAIGVADVTETETAAEISDLGGAEGDTISRVIADEEVLPFEDRSFDLAVAVLSLQHVNDLPGTLAQIQRLLVPDGLFVAVLLGGLTLTELRQTMLAAEAELRDGASPRVMPMVDVRDAGGLLQRAGFALPVTDAETLTVTYASALDLMRELKAMGATNVLVERSKVPVTRSLLLRTAELYAQRFPADDGDGRVRATFELVTMTGWSPDPSQQKPLKPGSAQISLTEVLKPRD